MGKVVSKITKPLKNYNIENRAQNLIKSELPRPAPRHPSTVAKFDKVTTEHPEFLEEQKRKDLKLDEFLRKVRVNSVGSNSEIRAKLSGHLPESRQKVEPEEYGFAEPEQIPEGRLGLRQALVIINQHHLNPAENSAEKIALDYKLDLMVVKNILQYFQTLNLHLPSKIIEKNPKLLDVMSNTQPGTPSLARKDEIKRLSVGDKGSTDLNPKGS